MQALYIASVWLHVLAAIIWVGGLFFLVLVLVPWLRRHGAGTIDAGAFLRDTGARFRYVGWICFGVLLATGAFNLAARGIGLDDLLDPAWWTTPFGRALALKLVGFAGVLGLSAWHDFVVGPQATRAMLAEPGGVATHRLRRRAALLGRMNGVLALLLVALGVILVRGWPW